MSASLASRTLAVTPAPVRRRIREQQLRAPQARPGRLAPPVGRPVQSKGPSLGRPVGLRQVRTSPASVSCDRVQLTDRGIAVVVALLAVITVATITVCAVKFFGVSNAPLEDQSPRQQAPLVLVQG